MMDRISAYRELIRKNIDYENYPPIYNKQEVDELIELIVETLMLPPDAGTIRIGGKERPVPIVKSMFLKLDKDHICYILKCLHNTEKKKRVKMAVSKKQPEKKRQKKKSSLWIIALIAVILLILVGVVFLVLPKFRKEAAPEKPETIKVEAAEKSYAAGSRISEKNFRVYGISGKQKQLLDADTYSVSPAKVPAHGHSVTVEVSSKAYPDIKAEITVLIDRDESVRYKIGRENPDDVEAILYSNGDLEISGKGSVRNFKSDSAPWKKDSVKRLTWIDPEAEVESMDYWFTGNDEYLETLCRIPDTVRSMVETFKNATAMTSMPDMSGAVRLEDITSCAEGCIALEKAMELPGNIKQAKKDIYG
mgnify:CR=1 FL=1